MSKTINGKPYAQVMDELQAPFPDDAFCMLEQVGKPYLPVEEVQNRLDEVLGSFCYDFSCSELQMVQNGSQQNLIVIGTLTIRNDDGEIVSSRSCAGGCTIIYPNKSDSPVKVSNNAESASKDALKRCAKLYGIGSDQLREKRKGNKSSKTSNYTSSSITAEILTAFSTNSKGGYTCTVKIDNEERQLIIWEDIQDIISETVPMDKFIQMYKPGTTFKFIGRFSTYGNKKQVIVTGVNKR